MSRIGLFICFMLFVVPPQGWALTLAEALKVAEAHPALIPDSLEVERTQALGEDIGRRPGDAVELEVENAGGSLPGLREAEITLSWRRPLTDAVKIRSARKVWESSVRESEVERNRRRWEVSSAVQRAFHRALVLQHLVATAHETEKILLAMKESAQARFESGASPEREVLKAALEVQRGEAERRHLEGTLSEARLALARELGAEPTVVQVLVGTLTPELQLPERAALINGLESIHPDLQRIDLHVDRTGAAASVLKSDSRIGWSVAAGIRDFRERDDHAWVLSLEADIPNPKANRGERKALVLEREKLTRQRAAVRNAVARQLEERLVCFETNRQNALELRDKVLPGAKQVLQLSLDAYQLGKSDQMVVLDAQKTLEELRRTYFQSLGELYQAADEIESMCGLCLVGEHHGE